MNFRIADTFTDSLARLTGDEQKAVKTTAFDLQMNPAQPGLSFHKLEKAKDKNFWSVRVNKDVRIIVHRAPDSLLLCYVGHHDKAYAWAERRKLEIHPKTGAAQLVEVRERVEQITIPVYVAANTTATTTSRTAPAPLFSRYSDDELLGYGVPLEWLGEVRSATEDSLLGLTEHLPQEAAEALLDLATGTTPKPRTPPEPVPDPFEHPDAQRRFRVVANVEELARALDYPWDKWTVFLHPAQREMVERSLNGPARVSGSAGTGKTVVALHRAAFLARHDDNGRVLLATFSRPLASALQAKLRRLISSEPRLGERIDVEALDDAALRLHERNIGKVHLATREQIDQLLKSAAAELNAKYSETFLRSEWDQIVDAWQLRTWEQYRDVQRLGRRTRLPEKQRATLWSVFSKVIEKLQKAGLATMAGVYGALTEHFGRATARPYDFIVVDEAQDISVPQLRFLASIAGNRPNSLFFAGDLGQRIFQSPFSWKQLGVDVRGRSSTLRINYRTSHQIRGRADKLLDAALADVDGNEERRDAVSVFNGPMPEIERFTSEAAEIAGVSDWLRARLADGVSPTEIGVFVRSQREIPRATASLDQAGLQFRVLNDRVDTVSGVASVAPMHLAKGLEFRAVAVIACDAEVIPSQERIESVGDDTELDEVYATERHLLYVACTRARDMLLVSGVDPASEFLDDL
jgi:mRNA-degrading endonuclease RelE of RelBE toxin-antitoxin system